MKLFTKSDRGTAGEPGVDSAISFLVVLVVVGLINVVVLTASPLPPGGLSVRLSHHFFDLGHMAAIGWLGWLLGRAWLRWGPRRRVFADIALGALAIAVGQFVLPNDLLNFAARFGPPFWLWLNLLVVFVALGIPIAWATGRLFRRAWWRWVPLAAGFVAVVANHLVLRRDYPGAHIYLVWAAASLGASALVGIPRTAAIPRLMYGTRRALLRVLGVALATGSALSLVCWPKPAVMSELLATDSALLVPYLARVRVALAKPQSEAQPTHLVDPRWLTSRAAAPEVPASRPPLVPDDAIIVIMSADAFRAEVLREPENKRRLPHITALARRSVNFTVARSAGSDTRNSLGSLFTSKYYSQLDWKLTREHGLVLTRDKTPRFNVLLREHKGFRGVNVVAYAPVVNSNGFVTGFDDEIFVRSQKGQNWALASAMTDVALEKIEQHGDGPLLVFMHWMDAHDPYDAAGVDGKKFDRYFSELQLYDAQVGRVWALLERRGLLRRSVVLFTSDHGEALGEHNIPHHGTSIYEVLVRVPLMIRVPGVPPREVDEPVSQIDIAPTLLDLMGVATPGCYMGQSLVPFFRGESPKLARPIAADQRVVRSLYAGPYKVMHYRKIGAVELYDLPADPNETNNLYGRLGGEDEELFGALRAFFEAHQINDSWEYPR